MILNMVSIESDSPKDIYTIRVDLDYESKKNRRKSSVIREISNKLSNVLNISDGYFNKTPTLEHSEMDFGIPGTFKQFKDNHDCPQAIDIAR